MIKNRNNVSILARAIAIGLVALLFMTSVGSAFVTEYGTSVSKSGTINVALASNDAVASACGVIPGYEHIHRIEFINDGQYGNSRSWIPQSSSCSPVPWLMITFPSEKTINKVVFGRGNKYNDRDITSFNIQTSTDGANWISVYENNNFKGLVPKEDASISFNPVNAKYIKMNLQPYSAAIDEFEVYEAIGGTKESALELINSVSSRIDILKRNNLDTSIIDQALKNAKDAHDFGKYDEAYSLAQNAKTMADDAYQSYQLINSTQSEIDGAKSINADVSKAENKLKEAKDALAKGDYERAQSWANEAMQLAKYANIGTVSIKDLRALAPKYDEHSVVISGTIRSIETVYGIGYKFAMDDGSGMISVEYQGSLGDIQDGEKITASGIFQASTGTVVADNVQKSEITSAPAFEVILAVIGILMAFVLRRR